MRLLVVSYKPCWSRERSGVASDGGFPMQMAALSRQFSSTTLFLPRRAGPPPTGLTQLAGNDLKVETFAEPRATGLWRKVWWLALGWSVVPRLWRAMSRADVVHAVVPGDVGVLGLLMALARRRRLFVRHCGTWGRPATMADRLLHQLLLRLAGERCVVFATGGSTDSPSPRNREIRWIFSTSLSRAEIDALAARSPEPPSDECQRLLSLGRLTQGKNVAASLRALAELRRTSHPRTRLDVVGDGPERASLAALCRELGIEDAVVFHGNVDHGSVLDRLQRSHLLMFPTRVPEGFPKAVLEALACGVPVVAPRVSVLPHLLRDGGGVLVDDVESTTLAAAVRDLVDDPQAWSRHSETGRQLAHDYTLESWSEAIRRRLDEVWHLDTTADRTEWSS